MKKNVFCGTILVTLIFLTTFAMADLDMSVTVETDQNVTYQQAIISDGDVTSMHAISAGGDSTLIVNGVEWTEYNPMYIASNEDGWENNGLDTEDLKDLMEKLEDYRNGKSVEITKHEYEVLMAFVGIINSELDDYDSYVSKAFNDQYNMIMSNYYEIMALYRTFEKLYPDVYCESRKEVMKEYDLKSVKCGLHSKYCYNGKYYMHESGYDYCIYDDERPEGGMDIHLKEMKIYDSDAKSLTPVEVTLYNDGEETIAPLLKVKIKRLDITLGYFEYEIEEVPVEGEKTYVVAFDNSGLEAGDYNLEVIVYLGEKEIMDKEDFTILTQGTLAKDGEIVSLELRNEPVLGKEILVETRIKNHGEIPSAFSTTGEIRINDEPVDVIGSNTVLIKPGETQTVSMIYPVEKTGEYEIVVRSNENMEDMLVFEVQESSITGRFMTSPGAGIIGLAIIVLGLYVTRFIHLKLNRKGLVVVPTGTIERVKPLKPRKKTKKKSGKKAKKKPVRCAAHTKAGKKCKNYASGKSKYCAVHKKASSRGKSKK